MILVKFNINPMGAVRQTRADAWKKRPAVLRYRAFKDSIKIQAAPFYLPKDPVKVDLEFFIAMPDSWSKKKRTAMNGKLHRQKPDIDNMFKAVTDALWPDDDSCIALCSAGKWWATRGAILIAVHVSENPHENHSGKVVEL